MKIDIDKVMAAIEDGGSTGFCVACGEEHDGVEPDARGYKCEKCGVNKVFGAEEIVLNFC